MHSACVEVLICGPEKALQHFTGLAGLLQQMKNVVWWLAVYNHVVEHPGNAFDSNAWYLALELCQTVAHTVARAHAICSCAAAAAWLKLLKLYARTTTCPPHGRSHIVLFSCKNRFHAAIMPQFHCTQQQAGLLLQPQYAAYSLEIKLRHLDP